MPKRGVSVTGWWATFPLTADEPKKFVTKEDALAYWPSDSRVRRKVVYKVWWDGIVGDLKRGEGQIVERSDSEAA